ncbi:MAG: NTP transferase domain-containing protein [Saprospiraceae bacterium]|nr:NTP transferase domain-containing protein [Saprospiraceae bacterium]
MKIIIPMAGRGTRLRPHTLTVPKPLVEIAGKSIVRRLVEDLASAYGGPIDEVAFIIGDFGPEAEAELIELAESLGAKGSIYHQNEKLGTAHAILCAKDSLEGNVIVAFADTLFKSDFKLDTEQDGLLWVQKIEDPSAYGVVTLNEEGVIVEFVEKPTSFVSDLAIIGIYYFKDGNLLKKELQYLIDNDLKDRGEYQITNALENMKNKGIKFKTLTIEEWLDCGNKNAVIYATERVLEIKKDAAITPEDLKIENSTIIQPCFISGDVTIKNSVIGPHVSIGTKTVIENSIISKSIIQDNSIVTNVVTENSMLGSHTEYVAKKSELSLSDYSKYHQ